MNSQRSSHDISTVMSRNMLGVILGFCNLCSFPILRTLNKKFKNVITDAKTLPIFSDYISEKKNLDSIYNINIAFQEGSSKDSYIT
jgi:hypothetical protein